MFKMLKAQNFGLHVQHISNKSRIVSIVGYRWYSLSKKSILFPILSNQKSLDHDCVWALDNIIGLSYGSHGMYSLASYSYWLISQWPCGILLIWLVLLKFKCLCSMLCAVFVLFLVMLMLRIFTWHGIVTCTRGFCMISCVLSISVMVFLL